MDRNLLFVSVVILLVSAFVGVNFIYQPQMTQIKALEQAFQEEEQLGELLNDISSTEKKIKVYRQRLMEKGKEETELIDRVREIANAVPVRVVAMTPGGRRATGRGATLVLLRISFEGTYHQIGHFVSKIENSEKFIRLESLRFQGPGGDNRQMGVEMEISTLLSL